jgi:eukaryotic-like serine/threonine-protein kinase
MALNAGTRIGPYEISGLLGAGGMGEVYRAHDARLHRDVAVKTLPASLADDANRLARFQREAQVLAALSHPHIAAIFGLEESGGVRALVMELVEGQTLAERIAAGPIPLDEALRMAREISSALDAAHEKGIVHRDLKPANIKLAPDGRVKVLDFGLAKAIEGDPASGSGSRPADSPTLTLEATRAGMLMGTAAYMSPEQARGKTVDKRADIWAFGVVLYEMLTGRTLFEGETLSDTLAGVLRAPLDFEALPAGTPPAVRRLLERCLERDPKRRLRDMGDAWIEVDAAASGTAPVSAPPPAATPLWRKALPWAVAAVAGAAGIAWAIIHTPAASAPAPVVRWTYVLDKVFVGLSLSRDGSRLALMEIQDVPHLYVHTFDQMDGKAVPGGDAGLLPVFSPDGQWLVYFQGTSDYKLKRIPVSGGTPTTLCDAGPPYGLDWHEPDSILFSTGKGVMRVAASGGSPEALTTPDSKKNEASHRWPHMLPGGQAAVFTIAGGASPQVAVLDIKKRTYRTLIANGSDARYAAAGYLVFNRVGTLFAVPFDAKALAVTGPETPVVEGVGMTVDEGADFSISDTGVLIYMAGNTAGKTRLDWADRKGTTEAITDLQNWGTGRLSPDGTRIANGIHNGKDQDIWTFELERHTRTRLTFEGVNVFPIWTPDGRWITYSSVVGNKRGISRVAADGSGKSELLLETETPATPNSWAPDGKTLVFERSGPDKRKHLWSVTLSAGSPASQPVMLHDTPFTDADGQVSPDGRWLAYQSTESGSQEIYVQPFPGGGAKVRISAQGGIRPRWAHNGKELFYWSNGGSGELMAVDVVSSPSFHASVPQPVFRMQSGTTFDVAPDGKRFLVEVIPGGQQGRRALVAVNWFEELKRRAPVKP